MKHNLELARKILLAIEEQCEPSSYIYELKMDGYDMPTVAGHCDTLYQAGLVRLYEPEYADNVIQSFAVGDLTARGREYLGLVRKENVWNKVLEQIKKSGLPETFEEAIRIARIF